MVRLAKDTMGGQRSVPHTCQKELNHGYTLCQKKPRQDQRNFESRARDPSDADFFSKREDSKDGPIW